MRAAWVGLVALGVTACEAPGPPSFLVLGGTVYDGSGDRPTVTDVLVSGDRITFVGDAAGAGIEATDTIPADGLMVTPGFIDMHSHVVLDEDFGRDADLFLYQGITTAVIGVDGGGTPDLASAYRDFVDNGIGVNAVAYVGHGEVRRRVIGLDDRAPTDAELEEMKALVRQGMEEGAFGLSSGLFYIPGFYADTDEVIELASIAAEYGGIYDTHDRDLGASYEGVGYLPSIREAIRIGEEAGTRVIFSHFNAQGAHNYGRASEGAALIDSARARGLEVAGAQHVYTATMSALRAYAVPRWASAGGREQMIRRFTTPDTAAILDLQTTEMLKIRGGAEKILFADPRPELNGKTLARIAQERSLPVPEVVREILTEGPAWVMNLDLYDAENTRLLATKSWMMTCTDGATPLPDQEVTHPRAYGGFPRKIRLYVEETGDLDMAFVVRSMSGLAADFLQLPHRGYVREGMIADLAVFDRESIDDPATYENPHQMAEGLEVLFVNGTLSVRDGSTTGARAGVPIVRGGATFGASPD